MSTKKTALVATALAMALTASVFASTPANAAPAPTIPNQVALKMKDVKRYGADNDLDVSIEQVVTVWDDPAGALVDVQNDTGYCRVFPGDTYTVVESDDDSWAAQFGTYALNEDPLKCAMHVLIRLGGNDGSRSDIRTQLRERRHHARGLIVRE